MGTIKVLGQGKVQFTPDKTRVTVDVSAHNGTYQEAFDTGVRNTNCIKSILAECGLDRELAKISRFDVSKHRVHKRVTVKEWDWVVEGFNLRQTFIIELEMGCPQLTSLLDHIGKEVDGVEIEFGFAVSDVESAKLKVIESAVIDAKRKAEVMVAALGKRLGEVVSIHYGNLEEHYFVGREYDRCLAATGNVCGEPSIDLTPADLNGNADVEVVWDLI